MSNIRRQTIISSLLIYIGFAFGALNTYLFTSDGIFTPEQYGLTRAFIVIGQFFYGFAGFGITSVIYKFYPYYKDNLPRHKNDLLTLGLLVSLAGFIVTLSGGLLFQSVVVQKFGEKSQLILQYYYWVFPFTFFLLYFSVLESYAWSLGKTIVPNFLKEAGFRVFTTILILIFIYTGKNFDLFIKLFSFLYAISFLSLAAYLIRLKEFHLVAGLSRLTFRFRKKMLMLVGFVYGGSLVNIAAQSVDFLAIASIQGLKYGAVFDFSSYVANVIQVPQRSLVSASISALSQAWKNKDFATLDRIYKRSSLNLLLISTFLFGLIWLNYDSAVQLLGLNAIYYEKGKWVVFLLGIKNIVDMGTGVNGQIIGTSTYWRFDFFTGILLLLLIIPLNIFLIRRFGIDGSALSGLLSYSIYNTIRIFFLKVKFNLQPFTANTLYILLNAVACYLVAFFLFRNLTGWTGIFLRSLLFVAFFFAITFYFRLSPDVKAVAEVLRKKIMRNR